MTITNDEYHSLRTAFVDKALIGENIFMKSTPKEFECFNRFLTKNLPYDIIIDGLNVTFILGRVNSKPGAEMVSFSN